MNQKLFHIAAEFRISDGIHQVNTFGSGHIHDTYRITTLVAGNTGYILQRINNRVFPDVPSLMNNILLVSSHILAKNTGKSPYTTPELVPLKKGGWFYTDEDGNYWRMFHFIPDTISYDLVQNASIAREAGLAYGNFIRSLEDLSPEKIKPVLSGFHSLNVRWRDFEKALKENIAGRVSECKAEITFARQYYEKYKMLSDVTEDGILPLRITHNDTKINNLLFSPAGKGVAVIDLDTVMPGSTLFDYGDAIRTIAATAAEDERDLKKIGINHDFLQAFTMGFLNECAPILTRDEEKYLPMAPAYITGIMGLRFLTDYLNGDVYYRTHSTDHNLIRCRAQFRLAEILESLE